MKARVHIIPKDGVLDPQGRAVAHTLANLGYAGVNDVRQGKYIELDLAESDASIAYKTVERMCWDLLANSITEDFMIKVE